MCSIVSVADDPTVKFDTSGRLGVLHAPSEEDLSEFIVGANDREEGEGGHSEVRERNLARSKDHVEEGHVGEDSDEGSFEEERKVGVSVHHALLRDRQVSRFADQKVRPLHTHNRDQVASLRVEQSLSSVADLLSAGHVRSVVEFGNVGLGRPAAGRPGVGRAGGVEKTNVNGVVSGGDPVEELVLRLVPKVGVSLG